MLFVGCLVAAWLVCWWSCLCHCFCRSWQCQALLLPPCNTCITHRTACISINGTGPPCVVPTLFRLYSDMVPASSRHCTSPPPPPSCLKVATHTGHVYARARRELIHSHSSTLYCAQQECRTDSPRELVCVEPATSCSCSCSCTCSCSMSGRGLTDVCASMLTYGACPDLLLPQTPEFSSYKS